MLSTWVTLRGDPVARSRDPVAQSRDPVARGATPLGQSAHDAPRRAALVSRALSMGRRGAVSDPKRLMWGDLGNHTQTGVRCAYGAPRPHSGDLPNIGHLARPNSERIWHDVRQQSDYRHKRPTIGIGRIGQMRNSKPHSKGPRESKNFYQ